MVKVVSKAGSLIARCAGVVGVSVAVGSVNRGVSTYAKTKNKKQSVKAAFDVPEMVGDGVVGLTSLGVGYAANKATPVIEEYVYNKSCGSASSVTPQEEVKDPVPNAQGEENNLSVKKNTSNQTSNTDKKVTNETSSEKPSENVTKTSYGKSSENVARPAMETTYEYDRLGRITGLTDELGKINYTYDGCGNLLTVS